MAFYKRFPQEIQIGEFYDFGDTEVKLHIPGQSSPVSFRLEAPNGVNTFQWKLSRIQDSLYRDGNNALRKGYTEYQLTLEYSYQSHYMNLIWLMRADKIDIAFPPSFGGGQSFSFILENEEVIRNWFADLPTARKVKSRFTTTSEFPFTDEEKKFFDRRDANPVPVGGIDLVFKGTKPFKNQDLTSISWFQFVISPIAMPFQKLFIDSNGDNIIGGTDISFGSPDPNNPTATIEAPWDGSLGLIVDVEGGSGDVETQLLRTVDNGVKTEIPVILGTPRFIVPASSEDVLLFKRTSNGSSISKDNIIPSDDPLPLIDFPFQEILYEWEGDDGVNEPGGGSVTLSTADPVFGASGNGEIGDVEGSDGTSLTKNVDGVYEKDIEQSIEIVQDVSNVFVNDFTIEVFAKVKGTDDSTFETLDPSGGTVDQNDVTGTFFGGFTRYGFDLKNFNFGQDNTIKILIDSGVGNVGESRFNLNVLFPTGFGTPSTQLEQYGVGISSLIADLSDIGPNEIAQLGWEWTTWATTEPYRVVSGSLATSAESKDNDGGSALITLHKVGGGGISWFIMDDQGATNERISITGGDKYIFRFWAKKKSGDDVPLNIKVFENSSGGGPTGDSAKQINLIQDQWAVYELEAVSSSSTDVLLPIIQNLNDDTTVEFYLDKVQLVTETP